MRAKNDISHKYVINIGFIYITLELINCNIVALDKVSQQNKKMLK